MSHVIWNLLLFAHTAFYKQQQFPNSSTVQLRDKRPTHTQDTRTISAYTGRARTRATLVRVYLCYS